jgi:hypothetical protein
MAGMKSLDVYLALERLMIELDEDANPVADQIRDLMDPLWRRLSAEEIARLDSRGQIDDPGLLFPVQMPVPSPPELPTPTVVDQTFESTGWEAPDDWRKRAA